MLKKAILASSLILTAALCMGAFSPIQWFKSVPPPSGWTQVHIGGGGVVTEIAIANDGVKMVRNDTGEVLVNSGSGWTFAVTANSMPNSTVCYSCLQSGNNGSGQPDSGKGPTAIGIAPGNSQHLYMLNQGFLYYSTNRGTSWTQSARTQDNTLDSNASPSKVYHSRIAVDPNNENFAWLGSGGTGVSSSTDGGATWTAVSPLTIALPSPATAGQFICFDTSGGTTGGKTNNIFVFSYGTGSFFSSNSGSTWTNITGSGPTTAVAMTCDSTGKLWVVDGTQASGTYGSVWKYSGGAAGTWTKSLDQAATGTCPVDVAVNPGDTTKIYASDLCGNGGNGGTLDFSLNTGSMWTTLVSSACSASDVPWLALLPSGPSTGDCFGENHIAFDPSATNTLWAAGSAGIWSATAPTTNVQFTWTSTTAALESLSTRWITIPAGGNQFPLMIAEDLSTWTISNIASNPYASSFGPSFFGCCSEGWSGDWAGNGPSTVVSLTANAGCVQPKSGYSTDGGQNWTVFSSQAFCTTNTTTGGCIAIGNANGASSHIAVLPIDNGSGTNTPWYTTNSGTSWSAATVTGISTTGPTGWGNQFFTTANQCASDKVTSDKIYLFNNGAGRVSNVPGVWVSTDGGQTYAQSDTGDALNAAGCGGGLNTQLKTVFGQGGNVWFTGGDTGIYPSASSGLCYSQDGGVTWTKVANVETAICMGFGKAAAGHTYPTVWFIGWYPVSGTPTFGIWRSIDWDGAKTWQCQGVCANDHTSNGFPLAVHDAITTCEADPNVYGRLYAALHGNGFAYWTSPN